MQKDFCNSIGQERTHALQKRVALNSGIVVVPNFRHHLCRTAILEQLASDDAAPKGKAPGDAGAI